MRAIAALAALVFLACGARAFTGGTPGPVVLSASQENAGVRLRLDLERASMSPGQQLWANVTIENISPQPVRWVGGGCNVPGRVEVTSPTLADHGRFWDHSFAELKKRLVTVHPLGYAPLVDEETWQLRAQGGRMCTAEVRVNELAPHAKLTSRWVWEGSIDGLPTPTGDVTINAGLSIDDPVAMVGRSVSALITLPFTSGSSLKLSAARAFDVALEDSRFADWVRARFIASGNSEAAAYNVTGSARLVGDEWVIAAFQKAAPAGDIEVRINAIDGGVRSIASK